MPDPVADFFASQPRRPVSPAPARSTEDDLAGTIFADPVRDFFLHEGLHPDGPTVDERHPILSRIGRFSAGVMKPFKSIYDEVSTTGREASELARAGNLPGAFERVARPILSPFASLQRAAAGDIPVAPADRAAAATQGLEMAGIPASGIKASYDKGDWLDFAGQAVGTGALLALPDAGMTLAGHGAVPFEAPPPRDVFENGNHRMPPLGPEHYPAEDVFEPNPRAGRPPTVDPVAELFAHETPILPGRGRLDELPPAGGGGGPFAPEPTRGSIAAVPPVVDEASRWQRPNTPPEPPAAPPQADPIESLLRSTERPAAVPAPAGAAERSDADLLAELLAKSKPPPARMPLSDLPPGTDAEGRIVRPIVPRAAPPPAAAPPAFEVPRGTPDSTELAPAPPVAAEPVAQPRASVSATPLPAADDPLWPAVRDAARAQGFEGSDDELQSLFNDRKRSAQDLIDDLQAGAEQHSPTALMQAMRQLGGLKPFSRMVGGGKSYGDLESIVQSFGSPSSRNQKGGASVFRNAGLDLDEMVDALHQDPRWQHLDDRALIEELDRAARTASDAGYEIPSMESALRAAGVDQARPWWKDFGDDSFDPTALEPLAPSEPSSPSDPLAAALEPAPRATFAFNQPDFEGGSFPMYHIEGGPSDRSTVSADTLREMGIPVPEDALPHGEVQPRLPGDVGAVREGEVKTPQFEAPFALNREEGPAAPLRQDALTDILSGRNTEKSRTVAEQSVPPSPTAPQPAQATVRPNVKDFLTKRLNYSPEEVDAMGPDAAVAIGNKVRLHPEGIQAGIAAHAKPKPEPAGFTEPDPYFESPAVEQDALEKVLGIQRRMKGAKAPMVPAETVNEPVRGEIPPRSLADPVKRGEKLTATERADLGLSPEVPAKDEPKSQSEIALAKSKMTADARDRAKLLENPTPENLDQYVKLLGEAADRQAEREFKGGTGKDDTLRKNERTGEYLASGLGGLEKLYREQPDTFWRLMRGAGGALIGALVEPDDPLRGALIGGLAGGLVSPSKVFAAMRANAPGVAKALKDTIRPPAVPRDLGLGVRAKRGPGDISPTELVAGQPMRTLPDLWHQIREDLHLAHEASTEPPPAGVSPETWARTTRAIYLKEATATVDRYARDAEKAGNKLAAIYARGMAASMRGAPTIAERLISGGTLGAVSPKQARTVIRGVENAVYTNLLVGALDSGLVNRTQLLMAFPHLGKEGILEGIRQSRTSEGQAIAQPVSGETATDAPSQHNPIAPLERKITNQAVRKFVDAAWSPIGVGDVANRKQTYLGALFIARKYGLSGPDAHAWALDVTEQSQGVAGELGSNPFHRHLGFLRMFTKFPTIAVQLAHDIATHPDPKVRQRGLLLVSGAKIAGTLIGVGLLDLLVPRLSIANAAVSGVSDVAKHVFGVSDHALSEDLDPRRGGSALVGRYPMKLWKELGHFAADGFGTHHVRDATGGPKGEHSAWSGFMSLLGLKTAEVADERAKLDDAYTWVADQRRRRGIQTRLAKEDLARGEASAAAGLSRDQLRAFYRAQQRDQLQRLRQQVPAADRAEFDRRFKPAPAEAR